MNKVKKGEALNSISCRKQSLAPDLLSVGNCGLHILHGAFNMDKIVQVGN